MRRYQVVINVTGSVEGIHAFIYWKKWRFEESKHGPSSDAGDASGRDATQSGGVGPTPGRSADASDSSLRHTGHLSEESYRMDLSHILTAASTVQAEALRASDDRRCCSSIFLWITVIILYVSYWFLRDY